MGSILGFPCCNNVVSRRFCQCMRFRLLGPHIWDFPKIGDPNVLP